MTKRFLASTVAAGMLTLGLAAAAHATPDPQSCHVVRIANIGWTDNIVQDAVFSNISTALGYTPKINLYAEEVAYAGLKNGQIDVFLDDWTPSMDAISGPYEKAGSITSLAPI